MLLMLHSSALASPQQLAGSTVAVVQEIITDTDPTNLAGATIHSIAAEVMKAPHNGMVLASKKALIAVKVDEDVASLLMSHVFGSTEVVIGLHARKIV